MNAKHEGETSVMHPMKHCKSMNAQHKDESPNRELWDISLPLY